MHFSVMPNEITTSESFVFNLGTALGRGFAHGLALALTDTAPTRAAKERKSLARSTAPASRGSALSVGQVVTYRQGRGSFEATVMSLDEARGQVTIRRNGDGKTVVRPMSKVYAR